MGAALGSDAPIKKDRHRRSFFIHKLCVSARHSRMPLSHQRLAFLDFFFFAFFFLAFLLALEGAGAALSAGATAGAVCATGAAWVAGATFCAWLSVGSTKAATDNKERISLFMRLQKIKNR